MPADLHQLGDDEIESLVVGRTVRVDESRAGAVVIGYAESYRPGGVVILRYDRAPAQGRYRIADSALCVESEGQAAYCRTFHRDALGNLFQQRRGEGELQPIIVD